MPNFKSIQSVASKMGFLMVVANLASPQSALNPVDAVPIEEFLGGVLRPRLNNGTGRLVQLKSTGRDGSNVALDLMKDRSFVLSISEQVAPFSEHNLRGTWGVFSDRSVRLEVRLHDTVRGHLDVEFYDNLLHAFSINGSLKQSIGAPPIDVNFRSAEGRALTGYCRYRQVRYEISSAAFNWNERTQSLRITFKVNDPRIRSVLDQIQAISEVNFESRAALRANSLMPQTIEVSNVRMLFGEEQVFVGGRIVLSNDASAGLTLASVSLRGEDIDIQMPSSR